MARWSWEADAGRTESEKEEEGRGWDLPLYPRVAYYWRRFQSLSDCAKRWSADLPIKPATNCGVYSMPNDTEPELVIVVGLTGGVTSMYVHTGRVRVVWSPSWADFQGEPRAGGFPRQRVPRSLPAPAKGFDFQQLYKDVEANGVGNILKQKSELEAMTRELQKTTSPNPAMAGNAQKLRLEAIEAEVSLLSWLVGAGLVTKDPKLRSKLARLFSTESVGQDAIESEVENTDDSELGRHLLHEWESLFHPLWFAYTRPAHFFNSVVKKVDPEFLARDVDDVLWTWGCGALLNTRVADKWRRASPSVMNVAIDRVERRRPFVDGRRRTKRGVTLLSQEIVWEADAIYEFLLNGVSASSDPWHRRLYEKNQPEIDAFRRASHIRGARDEADRIVAASRRMKPGSVKKYRIRLGKKIRRENVAPRPE